MINPSKYGYYKCYNCLCEVCTRRYCHHFRFAKSRWSFCQQMMLLDEFCPVLKCDFFEHKEKIHLLLRVKFKGKRKAQVMSLSEKIDKILACVSRLDEKKK